MLKIWQETGKMDCIEAEVLKGLMSKRAMFLQTSRRNKKDGGKNSDVKRDSLAMQVQKERLFQIIKRKSYLLNTVK